MLIGDNEAFYSKQQQYNGYSPMTKDREREQVVMPTE